MSHRKFVALALAGIMTAGIAAGVVAQDMVADPAIAEMTAEQVVEARQATMRENGGILRNAGSLSGAEAVAAADTLIQNYTNLLEMYPEGSIVGDSKALPVIWEQKDAFDAIFVQARDFAVQMKSASEAGDAAGIAAAAQGMGGLCGQCHQAYRS